MINDEEFKQHMDKYYKYKLTSIEKFTPDYAVLNVVTLPNIALSIWKDNSNYGRLFIRFRLQSSNCQYIFRWPVKTGSFFLAVGKFGYVREIFRNRDPKIELAIIDELMEVLIYNRNRIGVIYYLK